MAIDSIRGVITIRNESGNHLIAVHDFTAIREGDIIQANSKTGDAHVLTPNRSRGHETRFTESILNTRRMRGVQIRSQVESGIRRYFDARGFLETRTPLLVPCPGMEPHIRPFKTENGPYLPTSPEFAMKRLLVGGLEKIFQICPSFRSEPRSATHHPEFTMLEWYRAYAGYEDIMQDVEHLVDFLAREIHGESFIPFQGRKIRVAPPWPRLRVRDLFQEMLGIDLLRDDLGAHCRKLGLLHADSTGDSPGSRPGNWDDHYFLLWLNCIEPKLPQDRAVFVTRYPASQAALSVIDRDPDGSPWARRFEVYAGGIELGNAFEELTDPDEQRARFIKDMELREKIYGPSFPKSPIDEGFLAALQEGMPPSGGIAMGVDRIVMLLADEPDIAYTMWLPEL